MFPIHGTLVWTIVWNLVITLGAFPIVTGIRQYIIYTSAGHPASAQPPIKSETKSPKVRIRQPHVKDWGIFFFFSFLSFFLCFFVSPCFSKYISKYTVATWQIGLIRFGIKGLYKKILNKWSLSQFGTHPSTTTNAQPKILFLIKKSTLTF